MPLRNQESPATRHGKPVNMHGGQVFAFSQQQQVAIGDILDFSANINPIHPQIDWPTIQQTATEQLPHYPESLLAHHPSELQSAIAKRFALPANQVLVTNGISQTIHQFFSAVKPDNTVLFTPIYSEYQQAAALHSKEVKEYQLSPDEWQADSQPIEKNSVVVLVNPSTPQGVYENPETLQPLIAHCQRQSAWLLVDESFLPFIGFAESLSCRQWLKNYPKLIILQSLSKYFACPGIRIGAVFSSSNELKPLLHQVWSVSTLDKLWLLQALHDPGLDNKTQAWLSQEQTVFTAQLQALPCVEQVLPSSVNYLIVTFSLPTAELQRQLNAQSMLIRDLQSFGYDRYHARIAIKSSADNKQLISALQNIMEPAS